MKKILVILLSLVMCMGLMVTAFGCGGEQEVPIIPTTPTGEDPDLGNDKVQNFKSAWGAFEYAKNRFENEEEDYISNMSGTSEASLGNSTQILYNERYKSSETKNFYFNTNCYGQTIMNIDPCMAQKVYKDSNSPVYRAHLERGNFENNPYGTKRESDKLVADFTGITYESFDNSSKYIEEFGSDPMKLSIHVIDKTTIKDINGRDFQQLDDGSFKFTFDFNDGVHKNYKTQVKAFSQRNYKGWVSTSITFTVDKYGRIKKLEANDKYKIDTGFIFVAEVTATTVENFYYGYIPSITFDNGKIVIESKFKA